MQVRLNMEHFLEYSVFCIMLTVLWYFHSYLEGELSREKELKKLLQQLTSIFANDLKKIVTLFYGRFQRVRYTHWLSEDKYIYAF